MQNQIKPQVDASINAALELANMSFSQVERATELAMEQAKVNAELAQEQLAAVLEVKDPAAAIELFKSQLENSVKSLAGFAATAFELSQEFQAINDNLKQAPEGSEAAVTAVKAAVEASNKALAEARKNAKKTAELAQEGIAKLKEHAPKAAAKAPARRKARA
jgi:hypothetical protein